MAQTHHVAQKKKAVAKSIQQLIIEYPIIAAVNMENLPAPQLQQMRAQLRGKIELAMTKRRIMKHAIDEIKSKKQNIESLEPYLLGMPALIFTRENPFSLFRTLKKSKTAAPAKAGQTAPADIKVLKGPTSFAPGPVIGELAAVGIKAGVENGKITIKQDCVICQKGEVIKPKVAEMLKRLGIEPMEIGLNIVAVVEKGILFQADQLLIDEDAFSAKLLGAISEARNLAMDIAYPTKETTELLIQQAFREAKAVALEAGVVSKDTIDQMLGQGERAAAALKDMANIQ